MLSRSISSDVPRASAMCLRAAALMAITFDMTGSQFAVSGVSLRGLLVKQRFGMSTRKGKNGFVRERFVSSRSLRRNIRGENKNDFNKRKIGGFQRTESSCFHHSPQAQDKGADLAL